VPWPLWPLLPLGSRIWVDHHLEFDLSDDLSDDIPANFVTLENHDDFGLGCSESLLPGRQLLPSLLRLSNSSKSASEGNTSPPTVPNASFRERGMMWQYVAVKQTRVTNLGMNRLLETL